MSAWSCAIGHTNHPVTVFSIPEILPWVEYCYADTEAFLWTGFDTLKSVVGVQQGDPLGPLLFALALHPMVQKLQELLSTRNQDDTEVAKLLLNLWYLDYGYILATHELLKAALDLLSGEEASSRGLHVNIRKCCIWWPTPPPPHIQQAYPPEIQQKYSEGTLVLNAPIGSFTYMREHVLTHVRNLQPLFDKIAGLEDAQVAFHLLRNCLGVSKMSYLLRVVPPACTSRGSDLYDKNMEHALPILEGILDPEVFLELQLPVQPLKKDSPSLGLGLTSAFSVSAASFLASASASNENCRESLPSDIAALTTYHAAVESHTAWMPQCQSDVSMPISMFCTGQPPSQQKLTALDHKDTQAFLPPSEERLKQFRVCMGLPGAKDWVYCAPAPGLRTNIIDREFRTWLQYFCQVPLFGHDTACPRKNCPEEVDPNRDHLLHCRYGGFRIRRHDEQVRLLASDLSKAVRHPIREPREGSLHRVRPDIAAVGSHGGSDYFDIIFVNPMAPSYTSVANFNPVTSLNSAHREKHRRFNGFIQAAGEASKLLPVPLAATGGWHPASYSLLRSIAGSITARAAEPFWKARNIVLQRHAALAVVSNALCLLGGSEATL